MTNAILSVYPDAMVVPGLLVGATDTRHYMHLTDNIYRLIYFVVVAAALAVVYCFLEISNVV